MINITLPTSNQPNKINNSKYKTILCKHFNTPQGCGYGIKCQFAHGNTELRSNGVQYNPLIKNQNAVLNYKIAKCKNWERDGVCKYGSLCTFAHGEKDIRDRNTNLSQIGAFPGMIPFNYDINSLGMNIQPNMNLSQMGQPFPLSFDPKQLFMGMPMPILNNNENNQGNTVKPEEIKN